MFENTKISSSSGFETNADADLVDRRAVPVRGRPSSRALAQHQLVKRDGEGVGRAEVRADEHVEVLVEDPRLVDWVRNCTLNRQP